MSDRENIIVGLDIGTTKVCAIAGKEIDDENIEIVGIGSCPSRGLRRGVVVNMDRTIESIKMAIENAELMSGCEIRNVIIGVAGGHIKSVEGHGMVTIRNKEITEEDIKRVTESANALANYSDREVLHVIPKDYIVDGERVIGDPIGMFGIKLEANTHTITGQVTSVKNLIKCTHSSGVDVSNIVLEQIASCEAVLTQEEKETGTVLIDIGGGTSDIAIFSEGTIKYTNNLILGGDNLDNDISIVLSTSLKEAKRIKEKYGFALTKLIRSTNNMIKIESLEQEKPQYISQIKLAEIIELRMEEIFICIKEIIEKSGYTSLSLPGGAVITGGSSKMDGTIELARAKLGMPVRLGQPLGTKGLDNIVKNPIYATGIGLLKYRHKSKENKIRVRESNTFDRALDSMKKWFSEFF